jgi:hypothetical protein
MSALFSTAAVDRIREMAANPQEKADLSALFSAVDAATTTSDLVAALPGTIRVATRQDADVFVVRQGRLTAVITVDPKAPGRMIVASLNRDDEGAAVLDPVDQSSTVTAPK